MLKAPHLLKRLQRPASSMPSRKFRVKFGNLLRKKMPSKCTNRRNLGLRLVSLGHANQHINPFSPIPEVWYPLPSSSVLLDWFPAIPLHCSPYTLCQPLLLIVGINFRGCFRIVGQYDFERDFQLCCSSNSSTSTGSVDTRAVDSRSRISPNLCSQIRLVSLLRKK